MNLKPRKTQAEKDKDFIIRTLIKAMALHGISLMDLEQTLKRNAWK